MVLEINWKVSSEYIYRKIVTYLTQYQLHCRKMSLFSFQNFFVKSPCYIETTESSTLTKAKTFSDKWKKNLVKASERKRKILTWRNFLSKKTLKFKAHSTQCGNFTNFPPFQNFSVKLKMENLLNLPLENGYFWGIQYVSKDTL